MSGKLSRPEGSAIAGQSVHDQCNFSFSRHWLLDRLQDSTPHSAAFHVALIEQLTGPLSRPNRPILAVLVDQQLRGAEYVGVGNRPNEIHFALS
jgi:hypothetical protein